MKWLFKLLRKTCRTTFFENTSRCNRKCKKHFFCDVTKVENFDKKCITLSKKNKQSPFKHIRFGRSKSPVKGLRVNDNYVLLFVEQIINCFLLRKLSYGQLSQNFIQFFVASCKFTTTKQVKSLCWICGKQ
jgi:hypothetical protein